MNTTSTQFKYLAPNAKSSYKSHFVKGTRIRARVLYGWYASEEEPLTPEEIAEQFSLPVEAVREAIAYIESDPPELLEDYAREERLMEASGMNDSDYKQHPSPKLLSPQEWASVLVQPEVEKRGFEVAYTQTQELFHEVTPTFLA